jgi:hypothetical protein
MAFAKYIPVLTILLLLYACKQRVKPALQQQDHYTLTVHLPFESCNYMTAYGEGENNFVLKDSSGKICSASLDTITKSGGTVTYDSLLATRYTYSVNTIIGETVTRSFRLKGDSTLELYPEYIYDVKDIFTLEELATADTINIRLYDSKQQFSMAFYKGKAKYSISMNDDTDRKKTVPAYKDSATCVQALAEFQGTLYALLGMDVLQPDHSYHYEPDNFCGIKTGNAFVAFSDIREADFIKARQKFIEAILHNN